MSECCCLPNLGCLSIPVLQTSIEGQQGPQGEQGEQGEQGQAGNAGAPGENGVARLNYSDTPVPSTTNLTWETLYSFDLDGDTLFNNGDTVVITAIHKINANIGADIPSRRITFNGASCTINSSAEPVSEYRSASNLYKTVVQLVKTSNTIAMSLSESDLNTSYSNFFTIRLKKYLSGQDFGVVNQITFDVYDGTIGQTILQSITIDKITAQ